MTHSVDSSIDVVLCLRGYILLGRRGAVGLSRGVALVHGENPLLPFFSGAQAVNTVLGHLIFDIPELPSNMTKELKVFGQGLDPLETGDEVQHNESLGIHMFPKEQILAQVIHRKVVFAVHLLDSVLKHEKGQRRDRVVWSHSCIEIMPITEKGSM